MNRSEYQRNYQQDYKKRVRVLKVTLANADYSRLAKLADHEGKKPTTLARKFILSGINGDTFIPSQVEAELRTMRFLMRNIANNLNQIAHHSNTVRFVADEKAVFSGLRDLETLVFDYTRGRLAERRSE